MSAPKQLVWLITGTSTGFGRELALSLLKRGDKVVATSRSVSKIQDLKSKGAHIVQLDVNEPLEKLQNSVEKEVIGVYGKVDVLVNNAGFIAVGALEENTPQETYEQFNTNIFGALNMTRAVLPYMRAQKSGTVVWIGSIGGWRGIANVGLYCATKYATRGLAESLHLEISPLGLRSLYLEPGYFRTSFLNTGHRAPQVSRISDYADITAEANESLEKYNNQQPGDPMKFVEVLIGLVKNELKSRSGKTEVPFGIPVGSDSFDLIKSKCEEELEILEDWKDVINSTDFPKAA